MKIKMPKINLNPVKILEDVGKEVSKGVGNVLRETATGLHGVGDGIKSGVSWTSNTVNRELGNTAKHIERGTAEYIENIAYGVKTGDWTSFVNRSVLGGVVGNEAFGAATGTKSAKEKMVDKADAQKAQAIADAAAATESARLSAINEYIAQQVETRRRSPGKSQTILTGLDGSGTGGTLLTRRG